MVVAIPRRGACARRSVTLRPAAALPLPLLLLLFCCSSPAHAQDPPRGTESLLFFSAEGLHEVHASTRGGLRTVFEEPRVAFKNADGLPHFSTLCVDDAAGVCFWAENIDSEVSVWAVKYRSDASGPPLPTDPVTVPPPGTDAKVRVASVKDSYKVIGCAVDAAAKKVYFSGVDSAAKSVALYSVAYAAASGAVDIRSTLGAIEPASTPLVLPKMPEGCSVLFKGPNTVYVAVSTPDPAAPPNAGSATAMYRATVGGAAPATLAKVDAFFASSAADPASGAAANFTADSVGGHLAHTADGTGLLMLDSLFTGTPRARVSRLITATLGADPSGNREVWSAPSALPPPISTVATLHGALQAGFALLPGTADSIAFAASKLAGSTLPTALYAATLAQKGADRVLIYDPPNGMLDAHGLGPLAVITPDKSIDLRDTPAPSDDTPVPKPTCETTGTAGDCLALGSTTVGGAKTPLCAWNIYEKYCHTYTDQLCLEQNDPAACHGYGHCHWHAEKTACSVAIGCGQHHSSAECAGQTDSHGNKCEWKGTTELCGKAAVSERLQEAKKFDLLLMIIIILIVVVCCVLLAVVAFLSITKTDSKDDELHEMRQAREAKRLRKERSKHARDSESQPDAASWQALRGLEEVVHPHYVPILSREEMGMARSASTESKDSTLPDEEELWAGAATGPSLTPLDTASTLPTVPLKVERTAREKSLMLEIARMDSKVRSARSAIANGRGARSGSPSVVSMAAATAVEGEANPLSPTGLGGSGGSGDVSTPRALRPPPGAAVASPAPRAQGSLSEVRLAAAAAAATTKPRRMSRGRPVPRQLEMTTSSYAPAQGMETGGGAARATPPAATTPETPTLPMPLTQGHGSEALLRNVSALASTRNY